MSVQTSYDINMAAGLPGLFYGIAPRDVVSRAVETVAGIEFGLAVSRGTDKEKQIVLGGTDFLGITVRSLDKEGQRTTGAIQWDEKETAPVLRTGYIYAICTSGCAAGDAVKYVNATGVLDSGAAAAGETALDNAKWETAAAAGSVGVIRIEGSDTTAGA